jgi:S1-C subfamily serine protease
MSIHYEAAMVRIWKSGQQKPTGAGVLAINNHIVTCEHVVRKALALSSNVNEAPLTPVEFDFPFLMHQSRCSGRVIYWDTQGDLAVLEALATLPENSHPVQLAENIAEYLFQDQTVWSYGFPDGYDQGVWAEGKLIGGLAGGSIQIDGIRQSGYFIQPGFSGSPVWNHKDERRTAEVLGIVRASDKDREVRSGFMIPTSFFPPFVMEGRGQINLLSTTKIRETLQKRRDNLHRRYAAESARLDAVDPISDDAEQIEAKLRHLRQKINEVERDLRDGPESL